MDSEEVDLIVKAIAEGFSQAADDIKGLGEKTEETGTKTQATSFKFTELKSALGLAREGVQMLSGIYEEVIGKTLAWGQTVEDLSRVSGESTEAASRMAIVFGDFGVDVGSLNSAIKTMTKEGLQFNMQTIEELATKYQAIQDPVERDAFVFQTFGRNGMELNEILSQSPARLAALAAAADNTNKVMGKQGVEAMQNYSIQLNQLKAQWDGLKVTITEQALPALSGAIKQEMDNATAIEIMNRMVAAGAMDRAAMVLYTTQIAVGLANTTKFVQDNSAWLHENSTATRELRDNWDQLATSQRNLVFAGKEQDDNWGKLLQDQNALNLAIRESAAANDAATIKTYAAAQAIRDKAQAAADQVIAQEVQVGIQGQLTRNEETYQQVLDGNADRIKQLQDEITKYTNLQGQNVTVVSKGQYSAEQYAVAQERLAIALQRQAEYHGKSQATVMSLALAVQTAQDAIDKMTGHMADSTTTTADYSKKIAEDQAALDKLTKANDDAKTAMDAANKAFVFQQASAGLTGQALLDLALKMGQIDKPTYDAELAIQKLKDQFAQDKDLGKFESGLGLIVDKLNGVVPAADKIPDVLQPATQSFYDASVAASVAAQQMHALRDAEDELHDVTVTITTIRRDILETIKDQTVTSPSSTKYGGKYAGGTDFIIPPGFYENFPIGNGGASSGERVTVTPADQGGAVSRGGDTYHITVNAMGLPTQIADQVAAAVQTKLAGNLRAASRGGLKAIAGS